MPLLALRARRKGTAVASMPGCCSHLWSGAEVVLAQQVSGKVVVVVVAHSWEQTEAWSGGV